MIPAQHNLHPFTDSPSPRPFRTPSRRGVASVLAMLYLVLFSILAVGFYAGTTTAVQVVGNERRVALAQVAAESGMDFIRYHLAQITIPHGVHQADLFPTIYAALQNSLENTGNITSISRVNNVIHIPAHSHDYVNADSIGSRFRITIEDLGQKIRIKAVGRHNDYHVLRAVQMDYDLAEKASAIFDFGVASKGKITTGGSSHIKGATDPKKGSVLSTCLTDPTPVIIGGHEVSGDISITNPSGNVSYSGASVGGDTDPILIAKDHIHKGVPEPEFPTIDTDAFKAYATNIYTGGKTLTNCVIPANTNPKFTGGVTINGVLYVETPNKIDFGGNAVVNGVIVVQNEPTGSPSVNQINFTGTVNASPVSSLDPSIYGDLTKLTGSFLLAPNFAVSFTGNFGTIGGSIIASKISMTGNAEGTVQGSVINIDDTVMTVNGSAEITIASTGTTDYPAGVFFSSHYVPLPDTYLEVQP